MQTDTLVLSAQKLIPFIFLIYVVCISIEMAAAKFGAKKVYDFDDTLQNFLMFFVNRMMGGLGGAFMFACLLASEKFVPWKVSGLFGALVTFAVVDLLFYLQHRVFHTDSIFAPFHEIHHTSEHYNFTTTLRASVFLPFINPLFYVPAVLFGCNALSIIICFSLIQVYQFFLHTQFLPALGPLEGLVNTPSAHRVHHGREPHQYEANLGGVLLVWDRLLGSYLAEPAELRFGIKGSKPKKNFFVAQVSPFVSYGTRLIKRRSASISERSK